MSMISSLIDELRKSADEWNGSNMFELARMCSEAADIIWQLRDDLQRANAENAKLREEVEQWHRLTAGIELPKYPVTEFHPKDLERENTKLRELLQRLLTEYRYMSVRPRRIYMRHEERMRAIENEMHELGIEVPD